MLLYSKLDLVNEKIIVGQLGILSIAYSSLLIHSCITITSTDTSFQTFEQNTSYNKHVDSGITYLQ